MIRETIFGKVFKYLEENENIKIVDLISHFPEYNKLTLKNYRATFRKRKGIGDGERKSYKPETLSFLEALTDKQLAEMSNTQLKEKFPKPSLVTL